MTDQANYELEIVSVLPGQYKRPSLPVNVTGGDLPYVLAVGKQMHKLCNERIGKYENGGKALAHCQVDHVGPVRFFVLMNGAIVINPKILKRENKFTNIEGCMSFPFRDPIKVTRHKKIVAEWYTIKGEKMEQTLQGDVAMIFQHEVSHLNGISIYD